MKPESKTEILSLIDRIATEEVNAYEAASAIWARLSSEMQPSEYPRALLAFVGYVGEIQDHREDRQLQRAPHRGASG